MKVTMISKEYWPYIYGGAGVHVDCLTRELKKIMDVEVRSFGDQNVKEPSLTVTGFKGWERMKEASNDEEKKLSGVLDTLGVNLDIVRSPMNSDVVHTHTWYTGLAGFFAKQLYNIPYIPTCHSLEPLRPWKREQLGTGFEMSAWCEKTALEGADAIIAVSKEMKEDILKHFNISESKIHVIHNGIDIGFWMKKEMDPKFKEQRGIKDDYILFIGRPTKQKGMEYLVEAAGMIKPGVQIIFGAVGADTKDYEDEIKKKVAKKKNILWINEMLRKDEYMQLYGNARLFVCPSIYEPFGITNLEAMVCGTAVVASATGGIKEVVVPGETGMLVEPANPKKLADAINELLDNPERAKKFGEAGRKRVFEKFSWEVIAKQTKSLYEKVVEQNNKTK